MLTDQRIRALCEQAVEVRGTLQRFTTFVYLACGEHFASAGETHGGAV